MGNGRAFALALFRGQSLAAARLSMRARFSAALLQDTGHGPRELLAVETWLLGRASAARGPRRRARQLIFMLLRYARPYGSRVPGSRISVSRKVSFACPAPTIPRGANCRCRSPSPWRVLEGPALFLETAELATAATQAMYAAACSSARPAALPGTL